MKIAKKSVLLFYLNPPDFASYWAPPYGLEILAAHLKNLGVHVRIINPYLRVHPVRYIKALLKLHDPVLIGISIRNLDNLAHIWSDKTPKINGIQSVDFVQKIQPIMKVLVKYKTKIVLGGSGFSAVPELMLKKFAFNYGVIGSGEFTFKKLLKAKLKGAILSTYIRQNLHTLPGIILYRNNDFLKSPTRYDIHDEKQTNLIIRSEDYPAGSYEEAVIRIFDGCSAFCTFCVERNVPVKIRPLNNIAGEIKQVAKQGFRKIFLACSELNIPGEAFLQALCQTIKSCNPENSLAIRSYFNPLPMSVTSLVRMNESGFDCSAISFTATHFNDGMLKRLGRNHRKKDILDLAHNIRKAKLTNLNVGLILGSPGETINSLNDTLKTAIMLYEIVGEGLSIRYNCGVRIYPGTPLQKIVNRNGNASNLYGYSDNSFLHPVVYSEPFSPAFINQWVMENLKATMINMSSFNSQKEGNYNEVAEVIEGIKIALHLIKTSQGREAIKFLQNVEKKATNILSTIHIKELLGKSFLITKEYSKAKRNFIASLYLIETAENTGTNNLISKKLKIISALSMIG